MGMNVSDLVDSHFIDTLVLDWKDWPLFELFWSLDNLFSGPWNILKIVKTSALLNLFALTGGLPQCSVQNWVGRRCPHKWTKSTSNKGHFLKGRPPWSQLWHSKTVCRVPFLTQSHLFLGASDSQKCYNAFGHKLLASWWWRPIQLVANFLHLMRSYRLLQWLQRCSIVSTVATRTGLAPDATRHHIEWYISGNVT